MHIEDPHMYKYIRQHQQIKTLIIYIETEIPVN